MKVIHFDSGAHAMLACCSLAGKAIDAYDLPGENGCNQL
jgi:hypothetical protein